MCLSYQVCTGKREKQKKKKLFVHYFWIVPFKLSVLSVLSVLIAHYAISVHRCTWMCISVLIKGYDFK